MNLINKMLYTYHLLKSRNYEDLVYDCLNPSLRNKLMIKANYHREIAMLYIETATTNDTIG